MAKKSAKSVEAKKASAGTSYSDKAVEELKRISPLALPGYIAECEFYDQTETRKVLDDVVKEFEKDGGTVDSVLKPVMFSVADGLLEAIPGGAALRRKGLTPQRIVTECEAFSYSSEDMGIGTIPGVAYVDFKNIRERAAEFAAGRDWEYVRSELENQNAMNKYKEAAVRANGGAKNLLDEYTGERNITAYRSTADLRRNDPTHRFQAQPDHIVPLKVLNEQFRGNFALSKNDVRIIANKDYNFALTSAAINQSKQDKTNAEYVASSGLTEAQKRRMVKMAEEAQKAIDSQTNKVVGKNLTFGGTVAQSDIKAASIEFRKKHHIPEGQKLTKEQKASIERNLRIKKTAGVYGEGAKMAANQAKDFAIGNVVLYLLKPLYWELKDSFNNDLVKGVNASSGSEAIRIRFGRVKNYIVKNAKQFLGDGIWEFIKGFVSALIESIIGLFVGIFRSILKLLKEGIRIFVQAAKILWGKNSSKMSAAEKGDAIVKLIGASVASLAGIGIDFLLSQIGTPQILRVPLATMLSGIVAALFMYLLDKADLFSVKPERRAARVKEVFDARIADMKADTAKFSAATTERLRRDWEEYIYLSQEADKTLASHDAVATSEVLTQMAKFFSVALPYSDAKSFAQFLKNGKDVQIDETTVGAA